VYNELLGIGPTNDNEDEKDDMFAAAENKSHFDDLVKKPNNALKQE
jgi:hypothetical protein